VRLEAKSTASKRRIKYTTGMPAPRDLLIVALFILALRLPFIKSGIQGDDVYYLAEAQHAQIGPLHPKHVQYAFMGRMVDSAASRILR